MKNSLKYSDCAEKYIKIFIAGIAFPSVLLPLVLLVAWAFGKTQIFTIPFLHLIPLIWGVWNILYFALFLKALPQNSILRLLITGAVLGFLIAAYGVFALHIPTLMGWPKSLTYLPLIFAPILYAIFWLFIVDPLNHLFGISEKNGSKNRRTSIK